MIGFIAFDLDDHSSTKEAFRLFETCACLPRTYCYFHDVIWPETAYHNEYVGELCAIRDFHEEHEHRKICPLPLLRAMRSPGGVGRLQMPYSQKLTREGGSRISTTSPCGPRPTSIGQ